MRWREGILLTLDIWAPGRLICEGRCPDLCLYVKLMSTLSTQTAFTLWSLEVGSLGCTIFITWNFILIDAAMISQDGTRGGQLNLVLGEDTLYR